MQPCINVSRERNISLKRAELNFKLTAHNATIDLTNIFWINSRQLMMNYLFIKNAKFSSTLYVISIMGKKMSPS
jgi:hypothetical protein